MISHKLYTNGVVELFLDRKSKRNALSIEAWRQLASAVREVGAMVDCKTLLVSSAVEGVFCLGADISEFPELMLNATKRADLQSAMHDCCNVLESLPIATIALIDGPCIGGGCSLALACDIRIATARSRFGVTPTKLGLVYGLADTRRLVRAVGDTAARRLLFTGKLIAADEAVSCGMVSGVCEPSALREVGGLMAAEIVGYSSHTVACAKSFLQQIESGQYHDDEASRELFRDSFATAEAGNKIREFLEKA